MSIAFKWEIEDFDHLVKSCIPDDSTPYILKYMPKKGRVLEAGCGLGRYLVYLSQRGYSIEGIEISQETVEMVKNLNPNLQIKQGDISKISYLDESFDGVICLGVIEHFVNGPEEPLKEIWRVLKPGSYAVITVPALNYIRRLKRISGYHSLKENLKRVNFIRKIFKKEVLLKNSVVRKKYKFAPHLRSGEFFEYLFTKREFEYEMIKVGFKIIENIPIAHIDGVYHEFGRFFVTFQNWRFDPNYAGRFLNILCSKFYLLHNHMHLCVVKK